MADRRFGAVFDADVSPFEKATRKVVDEAERAKGAIKGIGKPFDELSKTLGRGSLLKESLEVLTLGGAIGGVGLAVKGITDLATAFDKLTVSLARGDDWKRATIDFLQSLPGLGFAGRWGEGLATFGLHQVGMITADEAVQQEAEFGRRMQAYRAERDTVAAAVRGELELASLSDDREKSETLVNRAYLERERILKRMQQQQQALGHIGEVALIEGIRAANEAVTNGKLADIARAAREVAMAGNINRQRDQIERDREIMAEFLDPNDANIGAINQHDWAKQEREIMQQADEERKARLGVIRSAALSAYESLRSEAANPELPGIASFGSSAAVSAINRFQAGKSDTSDLLQEAVDVAVDQLQVMQDTKRALEKLLPADTGPSDLIGADY